MTFHDFRMSGRTASDDVREYPFADGLTCSSVFGLIVVDLVDYLTVIIDHESQKRCRSSSGSPVQTKGWFSVKIQRNFPIVASLVISITVNVIEAVSEVKVATSITVPMAAEANLSGIPRFRVDIELSYGKRPPILIHGLFTILF